MSKGEYLLEDLTKEIRKNIDSNRKFLQRVFDDDFEPEDEETSND